MPVPCRNFPGVEQITIKPCRHRLQADGSLEGEAGLVEPAHLLERDAEIVVPSAITRPYGERPHIERDRLVIAAQRTERRAEAVIGLDMVGVDGKSLLVETDGLVMAVRRLEGGGDSVVRLGIVGVDGKGLLVEEDRLFIAFQCLQGGGDTVIRLGIVGVAGQRLLVTSDCGFMPSQRAERAGEAKIRLGVARVDGERLFDPATASLRRLSANRALARLAWASAEFGLRSSASRNNVRPPPGCPVAGDQAEMDERIEMPAVARQDSPVKPPGFVQIAASMV